MSKENIKSSIGRLEVKSANEPIERMYPKVKVRVQDFDDPEDDLSFSWNMMSSPGEYLADSPKCVVRVPTLLLSKQKLHPTQEPKAVDQKDKKSEETDRLNTRAISVTRPRAVLSSPDNDEMFGSKNCKRVIQPSPLRNHNTVIPSQTTAETPIENYAINGNKNSKRVVQPSPLRSHNMVQKRHIEHKTIPPKYATETPLSSGHKPASVVNAHTPSTMAGTKGKSKTVKDRSLPTMKQSSMATSSQRKHISNLLKDKANNIV